MSEIKLDAIPKLTEKNYHSWIINVRAILRQKELWESTREALSSEPTAKAKKTHQQAADLMTVTISPSV